MPIALWPQTANKNETYGPNDGERREMGEPERERTECTMGKYAGKTRVKKDKERVNEWDGKQEIGSNRSLNRKINATNRNDLSMHFIESNLMLGSDLLVYFFCH